MLIQMHLGKQADSVFAKLLNADPDNVIRKILSADRADKKVEQMKILVNIAKKEKLGIEGLKNALAKYMVDEAMSQSAYYLQKLAVQLLLMQISCLID